MPYESPPGILRHLPEALRVSPSSPPGSHWDQAGKIPMKPGQQDPLDIQLNDVNEAEHVGGYPESHHPKAKVELLQSLGYTMRRGIEIKTD